MKTIIAGSRSIDDYDMLLHCISQLDFEITSVVSGMAYGADKLGEKYAKQNNLPLHLFPAEWDKYGKRAGYLRNQEMAEVADACIVLWDGESKGSKHMIDIANKKKLITVIWNQKLYEAYKKNLTIF